MVRHRPRSLRRSLRGPLALGPAVLGALLVAVVGLPFSASPVAAAWRDYVASCPVNIRTSAATSASVLQVIPADTVVTTSNEVSGDSWSADCAGTVSGKRWFAIVKIGGVSVTSLFGVSPVYAAAGLFRGASLLEGIDVSRWQGTIDYAAVKASGRSFVVAKATEGIGYLDPNWSKNRTAAAAAGLKVGGYHFARPDLNPTNPAGEADWFVSQLNVAPGMLVPALDLEVAGSLSTTALANWVGAWLDEVYAKTGARAMIYVSPAFWTGKLANTTKFADEGYTILWVAHWFVNTPSVPANNWGGHGWTFWQYDDCGTVPGVPNCTDLDRFNGIDLTRVTYGADFDVAATPGSQTVEQGAGAAMAVSLDRSYFTLPINVTVSGLPPGTTAKVDSSPTSGSGATIGITTSAAGTTTPAGSYPITVAATANGVTRTSTATLTVSDSKPPSVRAPHQWLFTPTTIGSGVLNRTTWSATDNSGIGGFTLERRVDAGAWTAVSLANPLATSLLETLAFGHTYQDRVTATDKLGNTSAAAYGPTLEPLLVQQTSSAIGYHGTWSTGTSTASSGGSQKYATAAGAWVGYTFNGMGFAWVSSRGPTHGSAKVYVDGVYKGTVSLYASRNVARQVVFAMNWSSNATHTVKIVVLGTAGHPRVDIDAFVKVVHS
jgi:GH25 family lysozyme M1 (1,4-beta-N-acetylmuramidase)